MFNLFKKKHPAVITATLNARLQPMDRGEIEDALDSVMAKHRYGVRVIGGGTAMANNGEVSECDIEIEVDDPSDKMIDLIVRTLEAMHAPKGSRVTMPDGGKVIPFGTLEGLALYLNGTDLLPEVYQACSADHVYEECQRLLQDTGIVASSWNGAEETALYLYGESYADMLGRIAPLRNGYALCEKSRVEQIA